MFFFLAATITVIIFTFPAFAAEASVSISRITAIAAVFGFMIALLVFSTAHVSGGHLNPAVSFALLLNRKISLVRFVAYVIVQCCGACLGAVFAKSLNPTVYAAAGRGVNSVNTALFAGMDDWTALGGEIIGTGILVLTVLASADVSNAVITPVVVGLAVFVAHLCLIPIDGCSINPARSFGASAVAGEWPDHWIFWLGPLLGALLAVIVYSLYAILLPPRAAVATILGGSTAGATNADVRAASTAAAAAHMGEGPAGDGAGVGTVPTAADQATVAEGLALLKKEFHTHSGEDGVGTTPAAAGEGTLVIRLDETRATGPGRALGA
jgi:aquaporin PIP